LFAEQTGGHLGSKWIMKQAVQRKIGAIRPFKIEKNYEQRKMHTTITMGKIIIICG
jgi:hypothetical protein